MASPRPAHPALRVPASREAIRRIQSERKRLAVERAKESAFWRGRLDHVRTDALDDPDEWRKIPVLDKDMLRALSDDAFYGGFCHAAHDGIAEFWRSGGSTGKPLFYPRSHRDMEAAMIGFARTYDCSGIARDARAHNSFPLGIHPAGQMMSRAAQLIGVGVNWAGAGTTTPTSLQLELIQRLKPTVWMGMSSYGLHLANLAEAQGIDLAGGPVSTVLCSAEPLSEAKRGKLGRQWGARVLDTFGMTEAGMMAAEDGLGGGFRVWTDLFFIEVVDPDSHEPVNPGEVGTLLVTPLRTNNVTPFLRWLSGDLVTYAEADDGTGPYAVFPKVKHAHRTSGFFKVRGINVNHSEFEDLLFRMKAVTDFKCELVSVDDLDVMRVSIEVGRGASAAQATLELADAVKRTFEVTPEIVVLETGTLAREFEASVKAPRFADKRQ